MRRHPRGASNEAGASRTGPGARSGGMHRRVLRACLTGWALWGGLAEAAVPSLEHLYPAGGGLGTTQVVALSGKFDPWPPGFWIEGSGVSVASTAQTGRVQVAIAPDAVPGARWFRVFDGEGAGEPRLFVVGGTAEISDVEPNNAFAKPQAVTGLPVTINGRLDKNGDVDSFAVEVPEGRWLEARLDAYLLMSRVDAVLRLVSPEGAPLAWNHDAQALDPRVIWKAPKTRTVVVQVFGFKYPADSSIQLTGGEGAVYRLHLAVLEASPDGPPPPPPGETPVSYPVTFRGAVVAETAEQRHRIRATRNDRLEIRVDAVSQGTPWDPRVRVEDAAGKVLAENDDAEGSSDPRLDWQVPADGEYGVVVASRIRRGSPQFRYELTVAPAKPGFRATTTASEFRVTAGATNAVKVALARHHGHDRELRLAFRDLPEGVRCEPAKAAAGVGEATLNLIAATNAPATSRPVRLWVESDDPAEAASVEYDLASRGENNGVPQGYSRLLRSGIDTLWLTVARPPEPPK